MQCSLKPIKINIVYIQSSRRIVWNSVEGFIIVSFRLFVWSRVFLLLYFSVFFEIVFYPTVYVIAFSSSTKHVVQYCMGEKKMVYIVHIIVACNYVLLGCLDQPCLGAFSHLFKSVTIRFLNLLICGRETLLKKTPQNPKETKHNVLDIVITVM